MPCKSTTARRREIVYASVTYLFGRLPHISYVPLWPKSSVHVPQLGIFPLAGLWHCPKYGKPKAGLERKKEITLVTVFRGFGAPTTYAPLPHVWIGKSVCSLHRIYIAISWDSTAPPVQWNGGWQPNVGSGGGTAAMVSHFFCIVPAAIHCFKSNSPIEITTMRTELLSALGGCQVLKGTSSILVTTRRWSPRGPSYGYRAVIFKFSHTDDSRLEFSYETPGGKLQHPKQLSGRTSQERLMYVRHHQTSTVLYRLFLTRMIYMPAVSRIIFLRHSLWENG